MPFAGYPDFESCVKANQDKDDPSAYCAAIQRAVEGSMTTATTRQLIGVQIFSVGEHTDSRGITRLYSISDLDAMVKAFSAGVVEFVPIKLGHTSERFREVLAQRLEIPGLVLTGERGDGQASLGKIVRLYRDGPMLIADMELHEEVARMYEERLFHDFSGEILIDYEGYPYVLSALAMLGADRPAVPDMREGVLLTQWAPEKAHVYTFSAPSRQLDLEELEEVTKAMDRVVQGKKSAGMLRQIWNQVKDQWTGLLGIVPTQHAQEVDVDIQELAKKLTMQEGADEAAVMARLDEMMSVLSAVAEFLGITAAPGTPPEAVPPAEEMKAKLEEMKAKLQAAEKTVTQAAFSQSDYARKLQTAEDRIGVLERDKRMSQYRELVRPFTAVEGKPDDLASELIELEDKVGKEAAQKQLARWGQTQKFAQRAGVLERIGTARGGEGKSAIETEMEDWVTKNPEKTMADAYAHFREHEPEKWREFRASARDGQEE